mmetsp:Transcript_60690/g.162439  ORF Transcript_60690/g.162439 Transcript_60690/m.162439 type:complete len:318 (+) Transcript_60690:205-1158(+)
MRVVGPLRRHDFRLASQDVPIQVLWRRRLRLAPLGARLPALIEEGALHILDLLHGARPDVWVVPLLIGHLQASEPRQHAVQAIHEHPTERLEVILWPSLATVSGADGAPLRTAMLTAELFAVRVRPGQAKVHYVRVVVSPPRSAKHDVLRRHVAMHEAAVVQGLQAPQEDPPQDARDAPAVIHGFGPDAGEEVLQGQSEDVQDQVGLVLVAAVAQQRRDPAATGGHLLRDALEDGHLVAARRPLQGDLLLVDDVLRLVHAGPREPGAYRPDHVVLPDPRPALLLLGRLDLHVLNKRLGRAHLLLQSHLEHAEDRSGA